MKGWIKPDARTLMQQQVDRHRAEHQKGMFDRLHGRIFRPMFAVKISEDHGQNWKLRSLCDECVASVEPPSRLVKEGVSGTRNCDWCGAKNDAGGKK